MDEEVKKKQESDWYLWLTLPIVFGFIALVFWWAGAFR